MKPDALWSEAMVSNFIGKSPETLKRWRREGEGPAFVRIGRTPMYAVQDVICWMLVNRVEPPSLAAESAIPSAA